jgi:hypothetical protein
MTDQESNQGALAREWLWARITIIGGFVIALAVAGYFAYRAHTEIANQEAAQQAAVQAQAQVNAKVTLQLCSLALSAAKNFGIVPAYGQLASPKVQKTDVQGRYVCLAATSVTKFLLAADLVCRNLDDPHCISLYSITQDDGTVLFQRKT